MENGFIKDRRSFKSHLKVSQNIDLALYNSA